MKTCLMCGIQIAEYSTKYCSNKCQSSYNYKEYIEQWKLGLVTGSRGIDTKNLSNHIIRYIHNKYDNKCARCGWNIKNLALDKVVLEIDHIDNNSDNNSEENLILLCPNCHSITLKYRNLNKGHGRAWRRKKYVKIV